MKYTLLFFFSILLQSSFGQAVEGTLLGTWTNPDLPASNAHDNTYNEVWGLAINDHEFAVVGTTLGTHIIDVTDPNNPTELFVIVGGTTGGAIIHRDFHDHKGYLYSIADEGSNTALQIIDITQLPDAIEVVYDDSEFFTRSHNIFIDASKDRLYSLISNGDAFGFSPMRIFDIADPLDPKVLGSYSNLDGYSISQVHDAYVRNDTAYLNLGPSGFAIVDFADVDNPNVISVLSPSEYPQSGYNHSGWLTDDGDFYYMADETFGSDMKVLDLRNLPDIDIPTLFNAESENITIPHNQIVKGDKLYVSYYFDGLQVYDISDPINPVREMHYPTSKFPPTNGLYRGAWGVYPLLPSGNILVSDMQEGLFVIDGDLSTATEEVEEALVMQEFSISPNPTNGIFKMDLSTFSDTEVSVEITDNTGKLVLSKSMFTDIHSLDLSQSLNNGLYNITIDNGKKAVTKRLLVKK
ncbi:MAG: choice-of-anchor B domain-containing protein [Saprospiraceae bacterium]|jgi:choice-of-anchor B domain-containing protein